MHQLTSAHLIVTRVVLQEELVLKGNNQAKVLRELVARFNERQPIEVGR